MFWLGLLLAATLRWKRCALHWLTWTAVQAIIVLRAMSSYPGGLAAFSVQADMDDEVIDCAGQKLQLSSLASLLVERPNRFHACIARQASGAALSPGAMLARYSRR